MNLAKRFGPQPPQAPPPGSGVKPQFYECGICGCLHPIQWDGDCRDDNNRFGPAELDETYGSQGWEEVSMPGSEEL